jgi:hypothetical protein
MCERSDPEVFYKEPQDPPVLFTFVSDLTDGLHIQKAVYTNTYKVTMLNAMRTDVKYMDKEELFAYLDALAQNLDDSIYEIQIRIPHFPLRYVSPGDFQLESVQDTIAAALEVWMK